MCFVFNPGRPAAIDDFENIDWVPTLKLPDLKSARDKLSSANPEVQSGANPKAQSGANSKAQSSTKAQSGTKSIKTKPGNEEGGKGNNF